MLARPRMWMILGLAAGVLAGCDPADNTVAVPKDEAAQVQTAPTAEKTAKGKPALHARATAD